MARGPSAVGCCLLLLLTHLGRWMAHGAPASPGHRAPWDLTGSGAESLSALVKQMAEDPEADRDMFADLTAPELQQLSRFSPWWRQELETRQLSIGVEIILVGFMGDGNAGVKLDDHQLVSYLNHMQANLRWRLQQHPTDNSIGAEGTSRLGNASLPVSFVFHARHGSQRLFSRTSAAVSEAIAASQAQGGDMALIQHDALDSLVAEDAQTAELAYSLYVLNLPSQPRQYAYVYGDSGGCPGKLWVGSKRYLWVDLTAGPVEHGPALSSAGSATKWSFPNVTALTRVPDKRGLAVELAALVSSMCQHLLIKLPARLPAWHSRHGVRVVVVRMTDSTENTKMRVKMGLDLPILRQQLQLLQLGNSPTLVEEVRLPFGDCSRCVAAYTSALRSVLEVGDGGRLETRPYLDLAELRHSLSSLLEASSGLSYTNTERMVAQKLQYSPGRGLVIPVFLFDLNLPHLLLLDGTQQAAPLEAGVVAVSTRWFLRQPAGAEWMPTELHCQGLPLTTPVHDVTRPVLAALLETVWGVRPTQEAVDSEDGTLRVDYRWSVGQDIFSPLSQVPSLSFADQDAALRNILIQRLLEIRMYLLESLDGLDELAGPQRHLLEAIRPANRKNFVTRTNYLLHKFNRAMKMLALNQFNATNHYTLAMIHHDTVAHLAEVQRAHSDVRTSLQCFEEAEGAHWLLWLGGLVLLLGAIGTLAYNRLAGCRKSKLF